MRMNTSLIERSVGIAAALIVILVAAAFMSQEAVPSEHGAVGSALLVQAADDHEPAVQPESQTEGEAPSELDGLDDRTRKSEGLLSLAETRTYEIKMMARQQTRLMRWQIGILLVIAVLIALAIWLLGRQRAVPGAALSAEITSTLVAVEERQAKLTNILKDIQQEIDYIHSMSVPDLKKLIEQAERYIEQNQKDLGRASVAKKQAGEGEPAKANRSPKPS